MIKDFKQFILATSIGAKKAYSDFNRNYLRIFRYWDTLSATQLYLYLYNIVDNSLRHNKQYIAIQYTFRDISLI